jgi:hypothetical protein
MWEKHILSSLQFIKLLSGMYYTGRFGKSVSRHGILNKISNRSSRSSAVGIATGYWLDRGVRVLKNCHFSVPSRPVLGRTQPLIQLVLGALSPGRGGGEAAEA